MLTYNLFFLNGHVSNSQRMFHGAPHVIIIVAKTLMIKINPMSF
jgi:hypothetical protein